MPQIQNIKKSAEMAISQLNQDVKVNPKSDIPFSSFLKESIGKTPQLNPIEYISSLSTNTGITNASAAFAQAMLESEIDRTYKKNSISNDLIAQNISTDTNLPNYLNSPPDNPNTTPVIAPFNSNPGLTQQAPTSIDSFVAQAIPGVTTTTTGQPLNAQSVNIEGLRSNQLDTTPFQLFMDKSIEALEGLSKMEFRTNDLMDQYAQGKVSIEEVSIETQKLSLAISFATTVISQATSIFKEIQSMQI
jgi:flagellar hook-basal body complex protein FliE